MATSWYLTLITIAFAAWWLYKERSCIRAIVPAAGVDPNKVVCIVTGGSRGIGREIARALGQALKGGSTVVVCSTSSSGVREALSDLRASVAGHGTVAACAFEHQELDVANPGSVAEFAVEVKARFGRVDILVNNAGIAFKMTDPTPFPVQARRTTEVNYFGTGNVTTSLLPLLRRSRLPGGARVVTVSSSAGSLSSFWSNVVHPARKVFYLPILTLQGLDDLINQFVHRAELGTHREAGFSGSAYATSKTAATALMRVLQREEDRNHGGGGCSEGGWQGDSDKGDKSGGSSGGGGGNGKEGTGNVVFASCCPSFCRTAMTSGRFALRASPPSSPPVTLGDRLLGAAVGWAFWALGWGWGHSARAGADVACWLALEADWADPALRRARAGRFFTVNRKLQPY